MKQTPKRLESPLATLLSVAVALAFVLAGGPAVAAPASPAAEEGGRLIVLGFDGADARTIRELVAQDPEAYPNFARLAEEGTFAPLLPVAPPESPVSWAALNTGQNPAKTGVPGFVKRRISEGRAPAPALGHIKQESLPLSSFENTPIPVASPTATAAATGAAAFLVGFLLLYLVTRRFTLALFFGLILGAGGAWGGMTVRGMLPETLPLTRNPNQARNFWDHLGEAGVPTIVLDAAQAFDMPAPENVELLAGLGVPDARGAIGEWFLYTTDQDEFSRPPKGRTDDLTAGTVFRVDEYDGEIQTKIYGMKNFWLEEKLRTEIDEIEEQLRRTDLPFEKSTKLSERNRDLKSQLSTARGSRTNVDMVIKIEGDQARVRIGDQEQVLGVGEWSEFYELDFRMNWLLSTKAITRVRIKTLDDPHFEMFVNVLDIDPRDPPFWQPISSPFEYSAELAASCGLYETYGWPTATMPFKDSLVEPEVLLEDVEFTMDWREKLTFDQLSRDDWRCLMSVFSTTDRVQHMMYRFYDREHPRHDPEVAAHEVTFFGERMPLSETIPMIYRQMDRIVGKVLDEHVGPNDTLIVCSDHGFQSFRRQVHVNNLLAELGYLTVKPLSSKSKAGALQYVDWEKTRAYSLGMGFVYLNLKGRESDGIVEPSEADDLLRRIKADFLQARDPDTDELVCSEVYITKEVHEGPHLSMEADLLLGFAPTYRVSWSSTTGSLEVQEDDLGGWEPAPICSDNESLWSGGHVSVALPAVAGVFFSNRRLANAGEAIEALRVAPSALDLMGVPVPAEYDLGPLEFAD